MHFFNQVVFFVCVLIMRVWLAVAVIQDNAKFLGGEIRQDLQQPKYAGLNGMGGDSWKMMVPHVTQSQVVKSFKENNQGLEIPLKTHSSNVSCAVCIWHHLLPMWLSFAKAEVSRLLFKGSYM